MQLISKIIFSVVAFIVFQSFSLNGGENVYACVKFPFSFRYPAHYKIEDNANAVITMVNRDSAITISVNANRLNGVKEPFSLWNEFNKDGNARHNHIAGIENVLKLPITDYQMTKIRISGREAFAASFSFVQQIGTIKQPMTSLFYQVYLSPYMYSVAIYVPTVFYNENSEWFNSIIDGFALNQSTKNIKR